jgi:hypothetical protein
MTRNAIRVYHPLPWSFPNEQWSPLRGPICEVNAGVQGDNATGTYQWPSVLYSIHDVCGMESGEEEVASGKPSSQ